MAALGALEGVKRALLGALGHIERVEALFRLITSKLFPTGCFSEFH